MYNQCLNPILSQTPPVLSDLIPKVQTRVRLVNPGVFRIPLAAAGCLDPPKSYRSEERNRSDVFGRKFEPSMDHQSFLLLLMSDPGCVCSV